MSRAQLIDAHRAWPEPPRVPSAQIDILMSRLRKKTRKKIQTIRKILLTIRGHGYRLADFRTRLRPGSKSMFRPGTEPRGGQKADTRTLPKTH